MTTVEKKPVPIVVEVSYMHISCPICGVSISVCSSESYMHITCPVCGVSMWAEAICPVNMDGCEDNNG